MYFDAVLDESMNPVFNDTPENVFEWLRTHDVDESHSVCIGKTMAVVSVPEYLDLMFHTKS